MILLDKTDPNTTSFALIFVEDEVNFSFKNMDDKLNLFKNNVSSKIQVEFILEYIDDKPTIAMILTIPDFLIPDGYNGLQDCLSNHKKIFKEFYESALYSELANSQI